MIKHGIVNFFKCLKYYLTPLGVVAIACAFALSIALPGIAKAPDDLFQEVSKFFTNQADWDAGRIYIVNSVTELPWQANLGGAVRTILDKSWLQTVLKNAIYAVYSSNQEMDAEILAMIAKCINHLLIYIVIGLGIIVLGYVVGYILLRMQIKRDIAKSEINKTFIFSVIKAIVDVLVMALCAFITYLWVWNSITTVLILALYTGFVSLIEAYFLHGRGTIKAKDIINFKNLVLLYITNIIIYAIGIGFTFGVAFLINNFVGLFLGIPLIEITFAVTGLNADAYIKSKVDEKNNIALLIATKELLDEHFDENAIEEKSEEEVQEEKPVEEADEQRENNPVISQ